MGVMESCSYQIYVQYFVSQLEIPSLRIYCRHTDRVKFGPPPRTDWARPLQKLTLSDSILLPDLTIARQIFRGEKVVFPWLSVTPPGVLMLIIEILRLVLFSGTGLCLRMCQIWTQ